jgi:hypothetical protein
MKKNPSYGCAAASVPAASQIGRDKNNRVADIAISPV